MRTYPTRRVGVAPCAIDGCASVIFARGWCARHYTRWIRHGDPLGGRLDTAEERFWAKVARGTRHECWLWLAATNEDGYGITRFRARRSMQGADRVAWQIAHGAVPDDQQVLHSCDNPPCVNPAHLFLGTQQDNIADMLAKGRHVKCGRKAPTT